MDRLLAWPEVRDAVDQAREACTRLRWHEALRRRGAEAAAESRVRGAAATALLEGAELAGSSGTVPLVRDLMRGALPWPDPLGPVERTTKAAVQVTAATERVDAAALRAPAQVLALLHLAAAGELLPPGQVGRPRQAGERCGEFPELGAPVPADGLPARLAGLTELVESLRHGASAAVVAALVHAEVVTARPFVAGNGLVARAMERALVRAGGLDPTGVAVTEAGHSGEPGLNYPGALAAYAQGGREGVRLWLVHCGTAMARAAAHGELVADAVLAGRTR